MIYVQYHDGGYDVVDAPTLDNLLAGRYLRKFYRRSEERWVDVSCDPVRGSGGEYSGPERRQSFYGIARLNCAGSW